MKDISVPDEIIYALQQGGVVAASISGGKDSQALASAITRQIAILGQPDSLFAIHANLLLMDWPETLSHCQKIADQQQLELVVVVGDLMAAMEARLAKIESEGGGKPFWPSAAARYCTAHAKRNQIDKVLRQFPTIISAEGIRGQESRARAKKAYLKLRWQLVSEPLKRRLLSRFGEDRAGYCVAEALTMRQPGERVAIDWYPIFDWSLDDVWGECGTSQADVERRRALYQAGDVFAALNGWGLHPAYIYGNDRVSCQFCILASLNDLQTGAQHNPQMLQRLIDMEKRSGYTFKHKWSLTSLLNGEEAQPAANQPAVPCAENL